jgi:UDP-N-acetylmuramate dehydrogenase
VNNVAFFLKNFNSRGLPFRGTFKFDEPMALHPTFKTGGPADLWIKPEAEDFSGWVPRFLEAARGEGIPLFVLGGGANIVAADEGIRGIVLDMGGCRGALSAGAGAFSSAGTSERNTLSFRAGTTMDEAADYAAGRGFSGLEFLAGMPGTIGGGLWMNARCYGREMADAVYKAELLENAAFITHSPQKDEFAYKKSPYQNRNCVILSVTFTVQEKDPLLIKKEMEEHRNDREAKGHYRFPSAGSVFKNNRAFGKPTGKIIDELGLKGHSAGGAQIAPWHGNIIINRENARSADILELVELTENRVMSELGLKLEREILLIKNS